MKLLVKVFFVGVFYTEVGLYNGIQFFLDYILSYQTSNVL